MVGRPFTDLLDPDELRERTGADDPAAAFASLVTRHHRAARPGPGTGPGFPDRRAAHDLDDAQRRRRTPSPPRSASCASGRDVTEQRQSQEMLVAALDKERTAVDRLRQLDEAKNEFVSTVSHELRTPVTSIVGYTEMLADGSVVDPDPTQLPLLATIARNGQRLIADLQRPAAAQRPRLGRRPGGARDASSSPPLLDHVEQSLRPLLDGRDLERRAGARRRAAVRCSATAPSSSGCCSTC